MRVPNTLFDMELEWESGSTPWLRRVQAEQGRKRVQCFFCGADAAILSDRDLEGDHGRIEVYCDNGMCDAREVIVLVRRDGARARWRADVRALEGIDDERLSVDDALPPSGEFKVRSFMEVYEADSRDSDIVALRSAQPRD